MPSPPSPSRGTVRSSAEKASDNDTAAAEDGPGPAKSPRGKGVPLCLRGAGGEAFRLRASPMWSRRGEG